MYIGRYGNIITDKVSQIMDELDIIFDLYPFMIPYNLRGFNRHIDAESAEDFRNILSISINDTIKNSKLLNKISIKGINIEKDQIKLDLFIMEYEKLTQITLSRGN